MNYSAARTAAALALTLAITSCPAAPGVIWWDGTHSDAPAGKLLSDNDGYWGDCVLTGVTYSYETEPTNPADTWKNDKARFGRRLLDGRPSGNWWVPVGVNSGPLTVVFDFGRPCTFTEIDVSSRSKRVDVRAECGDSPEGPWRQALQATRADMPETLFHRLPLPEPAEGRYLRLSVEAEGITWLEEVLVWGDAEVSEEYPEYLQPVEPPPVATEIAFSSIPGIEKTTFSDAQYWDWQREIGPAREAPAVWSRVAEWDSITDRPILPAPDRILGTVNLTMARNETECVALALTNTSFEQPTPLALGVRPFTNPDAPDGDVAGLRAKLRVGGAIPSRHYGVNIGPLLEEDNLLGGGLMERYLTNGAGIRNFPEITLSPAGSAILWLTVTSDGAAPGTYEALVTTGTGPTLRVQARVVDVTLPSPPVWLNTWSGTTSMFPFVYEDRSLREVQYKQSLGVTVWNGFPEPGSVAETARKHGRTIHHVYAIPRKYVDLGYHGAKKPEELTDEDRSAIAEHVKGLVARATELGMGYEDWYGELWDEPGAKNSLLYGAFCEIIREADPRVRLYCNPCFWVGGSEGVMGDDGVNDVLSPWYREMVDISVPLYLLLRDRPKCMELFGAPRAVNAFYAVSTQSAKSERRPQVELYRAQAWDAFSRGWNGWGFYSYYAPRGNPWDDTDASWGEDRPDYLMVYPGPRGPVPTRQSEAVREGWEDYCLLTLMRERGLQEELNRLIEAYRAGEPLEGLRDRALEAVAG